MAGRDDALVRKMVPAIAAIVPPSNIRRALRVDQAITDDGRVRLDRAYGPLRPENAAVTNAASVAVSVADDLSSATNLEDRLLDLGRAFGARGISVTDPPYGAVGDGVTDDTAAVRAAATAVKNAATSDPSATNDGRVLGRGVLFFPPGSYKITDEDALLISAASAGRGLVIQGAGREVTQIIFAPTSAKYLMSNDGPGWMHVTVRDATFVMENANASFMNTDSSNAQRDYTFERVNWRGSNAANYGFRNTAGADNYDTLSFWHCAVYGTWDTFFWVETTDLAVVHGFHDCTWEVAAGNFVKLTKGGNVDVFGGSLVQVGAGTLFQLLGTTHGDGTCRLLVSGTRIELRAATAQLINSEWPTGTIVFQSVDNGGFASDGAVNTVVNSVFGVATSGTQPIILWEGCTLQGRHEYKYGNGSYALKQVATYRGCEIRNYAAAADFLVFTDASGGGVVGGKAVVRFERCRGSGNAVFDTDVNWEVAARGETTRKLVSIKYGFGTNPFNGGTEDVVLPKNAIVVGARLYAPSTGWTVIGGSTTGWTMKFQTTEGTPTVLLTAAPGTLPSAGFDVSTTTLMHRCDSDAKRTIRLIADANIKDYNTAFVGFLEYIG